MLAARLQDSLVGEHLREERVPPLTKVLSSPREEENLLERKIIQRTCCPGKNNLAPLALCKFVLPTPIYVCRRFLPRILLVFFYVDFLSLSLFLCWIWRYCDRSLFTTRSSEKYVEELVSTSFVTLSHLPMFSSFWLPPTGVQGSQTLPEILQRIARAMKMHTVMLLQIHWSVRWKRVDHLLWDAISSGVWSFDFAQCQWGGEINCAYETFTNACAWQLGLSFLGKETSGIF